MLSAPAGVSAADFDPSGSAASRGAGGGSGGLTIGALVRAAETDLGLGSIPAGASQESYGLMAGGMSTFAGPPGAPGNPELSAGPATPGGGRSPNSSPRSENRPPDPTGRGETLENLSCSGVDDEALIAGGAGDDVGEIDAWPPHQRPVNTYPRASRLRSTSPGNAARQGRSR